MSYLAVRKEVARRSQSSGLEWKSQMIDAESRLADQEDTQKAVSSGIVHPSNILVSHQYEY